MDKQNCSAVSGGNIDCGLNVISDPLGGLDGDDTGKRLDEVSVLDRGDSPPDMGDQVRDSSMLSEGCIPASKAQYRRGWQRRSMLRSSKLLTLHSWA